MKAIIIMAIVYIIGTLFIYRVIKEIYITLKDYFNNK